MMLIYNNNNNNNMNFYNNIIKWINLSNINNYNKYYVEKNQYDIKNRMDRFEMQNRINLKIANIISDSNNKKTGLNTLLSNYEFLYENGVLSKKDLNDIKNILNTMIICNIKLKEICNKKIFRYI